MRDDGPRPAEVVAVELVELGGDDAGRAGPGRDGRPARPWARRLTAVAVTVLVVLLGAAWAADRRTADERREALAAVPGLVASLDAPLVEGWRSAGAVPVAAADGVVVLQSFSGVELRGVAADTGAEVWRLDGAEPMICRGAAPQEPIRRRGPFSGLPLTADRVVCVTDSGVPEADGTVSGTAVVVLVDTPTGDVVGELDLDAPTLGVEVAGTDLLLAIARGHDVVVERRPADLSTPVWTATLTGAVPAVQDGGWVFSVSEEMVWAGTVGTPPIALDDGRPVPEAARDDAFYTEAVRLPDGGRVEWDVDLLSRPTGLRVLGPDGEARFAADGTLWRPDVTDGSAPDVLLVRRVASPLDQPGAGTGELVGLDPATGTTLWSAGRFPGMEPLVQVDGLVVAVGAGTVAALEVATGRVVWRDDSGYDVTVAGLTDGTSVLAVRADGTELVALDLRTGAQRWSAPLPGPVWLLEPVGRAVLAVTADAQTLALVPEP